MRKTFMHIATIAIMIHGFSTAALAGGGASGGALETTQLVNKAELLKQTAEQGRQTLTQVNQYMNMIQNTLQLPQSIWSDVMGTFGKLQNLMKTAQSISLSGAFDFEKFKLDFPGVRDLEDFVDFSKVLKDQAAEVNTYAQGVLEANGMGVQDIADDQAIIEQLHEASKTSDGQMKALQAGNQIATFGLQILDKTRFELLRMNELQTKWMMDERQKENDRHQALEQAIGKWHEISPPKSFD
jgi:P-type conjugative transfer protein TrbJ